MILRRELESLGHNVFVFTTTVSRKQGVAKDPNVFRLPSMPFVFMPQNRMALMYPPKLLLRMKKFKLDIIHTQTEFPLGIFGKVVSKALNIPLVHTYHTMYEDYTHYVAKGLIVTPGIARRYSRVFCNRSKAVIAPVAKARDSLQSYGVKRPIHVIPTGIDFEPFDPALKPVGEKAAVKAELGVPPGSPVMLFIGRIAIEKSIDVILRQMPRITRLIPNIRFVLIGDGGAKLELEALADGLGVSDNVIFAGSRPFSQIGKYYRIGDVYVCASTSETQGLTYIEAIAAHVPVIAKRDPSVEGIVINGETGFIFDDEDDLPGIIKGALSNPKRLRQISADARSAIDHLSSAEFGARVEELYKSVVEEAEAQKPKGVLGLLKRGKKKEPRESGKIRIESKRFEKLIDKREK